MFAATKSVLTVAPDASHGTAGQTNKGARPAGVRGFSLDGAKNFGDSEHAG